MAKAAKTRAREIGLILVSVVLMSPALATAQGMVRMSETGEDIRLDLNRTPREAQPVGSPTVGKPQVANFLGEDASRVVVRLANWVVASGDNHELPFVVVDKIGAKVFVFDRLGQLRGATFALMGKARGDRSAPDIGSRKLSAIRPEERETPAGRFVATLGHDLTHDILWIDYDAAISMHRVITGSPGDHRLKRLATASPLDKRITYGCINVPVRFYEDVVQKSFTGTNGIVYILPEVEAVRDVFPLSEIEVSGR